MTRTRFSIFGETNIPRYNYENSEYSVNWRDIIFLPFNQVWQLIITFGVLINIFLVVYDLAYEDDDAIQKYAQSLYYIVEILYLADTLLNLMHRNMPIHRVTREHLMKNILLISIDIITLFPLYEFLLLLHISSHVKQSTSLVREIVRVKSVLRLYRVFLYFVSLGYKAGLNQLLVIATGHFIETLVLIHLISAIWYKIHCWNCSTKNWTDNLHDHFFNPASGFHWFVISYCTIGNIYANNWPGPIRGEVMVERGIIIGTMLVGYIMHIMILFGRMTAVLVKRFRNQYEFEERLTRIVSLLDDWEVAKDVKDKTILYYETFWSKWAGIKKMPAAFKLLPLPLQKEVTVDIFWEALRHSHLFKDMDMSFKRAVCMEMKSEFYLPGDFVFRLGEIKSKMIYVVTGVLQILTEEDEESPVLSFSSGTILGEASVIIPTKSTANLRCATYCELQTLNTVALFRVLTRYPEKRKQLQNLIRERIELAEQLQNLRMEQIEMKSNEVWRPTEDSTIKWIKVRWREISMLHYTADKKHFDEIESLTSNNDRIHCSNHLNHLVLSEEVELRIKAICLRGNCPFVLDPASSFRAFCNYVVLLAVIFQLSIVPFYISFVRKITGNMFAFCFLLDCFYFIDIYLQMSTAIKMKTHLISEPKHIILQQMKSVPFLIDVAATVPLDYLGLILSLSYHKCALLRLNRLFRVYKLVVFMWRKEHELWNDYIGIKLFKHFMFFLVSVYWITCMMFYIACYDEECDPRGWLYYNRKLTMDRSDLILDTDRRTLFICSLYTTISVYLSITISDSYYYLIHEIFANHLVITFGYYLFTFCISELSATFVIRGLNRVLYQEHLVTIKVYLMKYHIEESLKNRVISFIRFQWFFNKNTQVFGDEGILNDTPQHLKDKIVKNRIITCLKEIPLFLECDENFLEAIVTRCTIRTLFPGAILSIHGNKSSYMNVILRGYCTQASYMAGDKERDRKTTLKRGDSFPVIEMLHQVLVFTTVQALTSVEVIEIHYADIVEILQGYTEANKILTTCLQEHFEIYEEVLLRKGGRLPEMIPAEKSLGQGDMFTYEIYYDEEAHKIRKAYLQPFRHMGKWGFIRFFLMRNTVDTHSRFYVFWKIFTSCCIVARLFVSFTNTNLLIKYSEITWITIRILDIFSITNMYVRLHCQYYNEKGILVTHSWSTAKHYFKTALFIDIYGILPMRMIKVDEIFGFKYRNVVNAFFIAISRPFLLYRVFGGINYMLDDIDAKRGKLLLALKYVIVAITFISLVTNILQMTTCKIDLTSSGEYKIHCSNNSWLTTSDFRDKTKPVMVYLECFYVAVTCFTASLTGTFTMNTNKELYTMIPILCISFIMKWYILSKITSARIGGNVKLTIYQERVKSFLNFVSNEIVDDELIKATVEHYQFIWKTTQGSSISRNLANFHPQLQGDLTFFLYGASLKAAELFASADDSFFRLLGIHLVEVHYKKDAEIIRCNDVQGKIYLVYKGKVDLMIANTKICTMGRGGIFGCLEKTGSIRQTIKVIAKVHVVLLSIDSNSFHKLISKYPSIVRRMQNANFAHAEYLESQRNSIIEEDSAQSYKINQSTSGTKQMVHIIISKLQMLLDEDNKYYKIWKYIMCVHLATISSIMVMFRVVMRPWDNKNTLPTHIIFSIIDVIFTSKIYAGFHTIYVDPDSGIKTIGFWLIAKRYFKSLRFWLDFITTFPCELFIQIGISDANIWKYGFLNRVLRFMYLIQYYRECQEKLNVRTHLMWTYLFYWLLFSIQCMACLWWVTACQGNVCTYLDRVGHQPAQHVTSNSTDESLLLAYTYVTIIFATTGLKDITPVTLTQLFVSIVISCFFLVTVVMLASGFATLLSITNYTMSMYEHNIEQLRIFLQGRELSPYILGKVWKYCLQLWQRQRGEWMPALITEAPPYLRQDLMQSLYGEHLYNHFLFANTHVDFLRQLVVHLQRCVFFPGNYLAEKGDLDGCMYFIHAGEVDVMNEQMKQLAILDKGKSFGEAQGLYNTPHNFSYKAHTVVDALILKHTRWIYLLKWFPASREEIFLRVKEYDLDNENLLQKSESQ